MDFEGGGEILQVGKIRNQYKKWVEKARKEVFRKKCLHLEAYEGCQ